MGGIWCFKAIFMQFSGGAAKGSVRETTEDPVPRRLPKAATMGPSLRFCNILLVKFPAFSI